MLLYNVVPNIRDKLTKRFLKSKRTEFIKQNEVLGAFKNLRNSVACFEPRCPKRRTLRTALYSTCRFFHFFKIYSPSLVLLSILFSTCSLDILHFSSFFHPLLLLIFSSSRYSHCLHIPLLSFFSVWSSSSYFPSLVLSVILCSPLHILLLLFSYVYSPPYILPFLIFIFSFFSSSYFLPLVLLFVSSSSYFPPRVLFLHFIFSSSCSLLSFSFSCLYSVFLLVTLYFFLLSDSFLSPFFLSLGF